MHYCEPNNKQIQLEAAVKVQSTFWPLPLTMEEV